MASRQVTQVDDDGTGHTKYAIEINSIVSSKMVETVDPSSGAVTSRQTTLNMADGKTLVLVGTSNVGNFFAF